MSFMSIRIVTRFCNSSKVPRFLSSPFLVPRSICHCSSSSVSPSESENTSRCAIDATLNSVVKIFSFCSKPNHVEPWQKWETERYSGSGFVISGRRILTNAHVVDDDPYVQVRKHGSSTSYEAIVEAIGFECDLAILVIDNEEFWEDINPLEIGDIPFIHDPVSVIGYPRGGDTICVTKGIVSRVEPRKYLQSSTELLTIQTDAATDYGNSGGPVVIGNKVAGVAFQGFVSSDYKKINYMIPTLVIKHLIGNSYVN